MENEKVAPPTRPEEITHAIRMLEGNTDSLLFEGKPELLVLFLELAIRWGLALEREAEQLRTSYRELEPCGHAKNFLIGDEHGHFTCTVCQIAGLRAANALLIDPVNKDAKDRDACELCSGFRGGVPGNENVIDGVTVCDYCAGTIYSHKRCIDAAKGGTAE